MLDRETLLQACVLASHGLRTNIRELPAPDGRPRRLVTAGPGQFGSVWTRDFAWSVEGLLLAGEDRAVRDTLDALLSAQRSDGLVPRLLDTRWPWARFARAVLKSRLPLLPPLAANFTSDQFVVSYDSNALLVWAACRYGLRCDALAWAGLALPKLEAAMAWYSGRETDGLVRQPPCSDWKDKVKARRGAVLYTNLLRWKASSSLAELYAALGRRTAAEDAASAARTHARRLERAFWMESAGCFRDTLGSDLISSDGNLAACVWGLAGAEKSARVLRALDKAGLMTAWGPRASERYPRSEISLLARAAGVPGYHDDGVWLWQTALALRLLAALGRAPLLERLAESVCRLLIKEGSAGEVYDPRTGRAMTGRFYRSETPFTWSSAMLLEALSPLAARRPSAVQAAEAA